MNAALSTAHDWDFMRQAAAVPATRVEAGTARLIVLADGQVRGKRTKDTKGDQGFIDPTADN